jgi:predicted AlkP superfamily phosphohydrolase/phosphomutase
VSVRLLVLGWDSATFDVVDPLVAEGRLPVLAELMHRGTRAPLRSTWPPMTDCAWTSAFTGVNPGVHGIFGSWYRAPGAYACRYFSARDRRAPALWELTDGVRHLVWGVPMAYPPQAIDGAMVSTYGAPPGAVFCAPPDLQDELGRRFGMEALLDQAPRGSLAAFRDELVAGPELQAAAIVWAARASGADCVIAVFPQVDRAQHFFWRYRGSSHPFATAVDDVYRALDRATGVLVEAFSDANVMVVSDHGAGELKGDVNLGAFLAQRGYATPGRRRRSPLELAWALPPSLRRAARRLAPGAARRAVGATLTGQLGAFDWTATKAFLGFHSDLWLNLEGREPAGTVGPAEASGLLDELAAALVDLVDPATGAPLIAAAHRGAELYHGPCAQLGPDLVLDTWSAGYRVAPGRDPAGPLVTAPVPLAGVDTAWSADHRPLGIFIAAGPSIAAAAPDELALYDVTPTALALLGQPVPEGLDVRGRARLLERGVPRG